VCVCVCVCCVFIFTSHTPKTVFDYYSDGSLFESGYGYYYYDFTGV